MIDYRRRLHDAISKYNGRAFEFLYWDGKRVRFGNGEPHFTMNFKTEEALKRTVLESSLGMGEAYARGDITVDGELDDALTALADVYMTMEPEGLLSSWTRRALARTLPAEKDHIEHHYGRGDEFYKYYLDQKLQYSCAYFKSQDETLDQAQENKIAHTAAKLHLQRGQHLLDVGCGWGHLMFHAAETYGVKCTGLTLCDNQAQYIREQAKARNLPVDVRVMNYLELDSKHKWDRLVSVGMMCHIGEANADAYYDKIKSLLAPGAVCLLHCIAKMKEGSGSDPFVEKHVFPGYWFFSLQGMTTHAVDRGLNIIDVENLRRHYGLTAWHWRKNFLRNYDKIKAAMSFDDVFMRTWEFYLASVVAGFRSGYLNLVQMVMTNGVNDAYPWTRDFIYKEKAVAAHW